MSMWEAGREPAQPSSSPGPVVPEWSGPTHSAQEPPVGSVPVVPRPPDMGPTYASAVGSAPVVPVSSAPMGPVPVSSAPTGSVYQSSGPVGAVYGSTVVVRRPRWVVPALAAMGVVTGAALTVATWALHRDGAGPDGVEGDAGTGPTLAEAHQTCGSLGSLSDGGRTLYLDMKGEEPGSGRLTWSQVQCYLNALETPDYVRRHMESTRALDGRQSATWGEFEASWTYHPDNGLDVLIRQIA